MEFPAPPSNTSDSNEYSGGAKSPFQNSRDDSKRRSSSRSIKRRRFDDELVEYSLGIPGASLGKGERRIRTQSFPSQSTEFPVTASAPPTPIQPPQERRRVPGKIKSKKSRRRRPFSHLSIRDLGRWKPTDDLALITGVMQTSDLRAVHRAVKFSCRFTLSEVHARWLSLMYNNEISRLSLAAMRNLHPDIIEATQKGALISALEEELISSIPMTPPPKLDDFQELLEQNPHAFYISRTPKCLMKHWQKLKQYHLLPGQNKHHKLKYDPNPSFSDYEETMNDNELPDYSEYDIEMEMAIQDRVAKKEVRLMEKAVNSYQILVHSVVGGILEMDKNTLAVLRGRLVRYLMRSREIAVGRSTRNHAIDVDLSLEGPSEKVSRRQATIRLRNSGDFFMSSEGKRPIFVDGKPILRGNKVKLHNHSIIEICGLRFVFLVNQDLISAIRQEAVKVTIPV